MRSYINEETIHTLIAKYSSLVLNIALQNTKDRYAVEDIYQDVFVKLIETNTIFESDEHVKAWLIRVCINESHNDFNEADIFEKVHAENME